jgi:hypothetical protein
MCHPTEDLLMPNLAHVRRAIVLPALTVLASFAAPPVLEAEANPLTAERWKTRPVVVVVPAVGDALIRRIEAALTQTAIREAFIDREMVLYTIEAGEGRRNGKRLDSSSTRALLSALRLTGDGSPTFILVGKDGGGKMREGAEVDLHAVFAEIDRMPMRRP